jgi:DNA polymerase-3 subunit epsilon
MSNSVRSPLIAVIDLETTGLFPHRHDRILEIAVVVLNPDGRIERKFNSLIRPDRDVGPTAIHGITAADVEDAPSFAEITSLLASVTTDTVGIAAHNLRFDKSFLSNEYSRIGLCFPNTFEICTMRLAGGGKLADCCNSFGIEFEGTSHNALTDAMATAMLLAHFLRKDKILVDEIVSQQALHLPVFACEQKVALTRPDSLRKRAEKNSFLQRISERLGARADVGNSPEVSHEYRGLLNMVLEDRRVEECEYDALLEVAEKWGLSQGQVEHIHHDYMIDLAIAAMSDGVITNSEKRDLQLVAGLFGKGPEYLDSLLQEAAEALSRERGFMQDGIPQSGEMKDRRVCFTGELLCRHCGMTISREHAEKLAESAGLVIAENVTKKLDILVVADPHSQSGKAKKARQYGIRILHEPVFWKAIGIEVE